MKRLILVFLLALCGCAGSSKTYGPSGQVAHTITCKGAMNSWASCFEKAGDICGTAGYDVLMRDGSATPMGVANGYANASSANFSGFSGSAVSRSMLVQCKAPG